MRLGALEVRVITIYGYPLSQSDARQGTQDLLALAAERATQNAVPCIIAGDFNMPPLDLPAGEALAAIGYQEVFSLHLKLHGVQLPPTCKGATRNDTALLHPLLVPLFQEAWVLSDKQLFDAHDPLCFRLTMCSQRPCRSVWRLPRPWSELGLSERAFQRAFQPAVADLTVQAQNCASTADIDAALLAFSRAAESAAQEALLQQHKEDPLRAPHTTLPKAYRGRCLNRPAIRREIPCLVRPDRTGGYVPDVEVTSVLGRMKVRQVRRVRTLRSGLLKLSRQQSTSASEALRQQLLKEWRAVLRAKGYPPTFAQWVLQVACFHYVPTGLPSVEWVSLLAQYLQHDCDCVVRQQAKLRKDSFRYHVQLDVEHGHSKAGFRALRADAKPPFTEVPHAVRAQVHLLDGSLPHEYWVDPAPCRPFHVPGTASVDGVPCSLLAIEDGRLRLSGTGLPLQGVLQQDIVACTAEELHDAFEGFWCPILQRDLGAASQSLAEWPDVLRLLLRKAPTDQLPLRSFAPDLWNKAIRRMKSATSTGVCGWNCTDLKLLPEEAVAILAHIFHQAVTCQLPAHIMRARVCVLAKVASPESMGQGRPITVFSTLYRVWSSVLARQILSAWSRTFPVGVAGSMPGVACRDVSYRLQHRIELSLLGGPCIYGCSVDLIKAFNQLPWAPIASMMIHLGVAEALVRFWIACLRAHRRYTSFVGSISAPLQCYNGAPEGDPMSVVAMAAVCFWGQVAVDNMGITFETYVDNWSWSSSSSANIAAAVPASLHFLRSLALPVDGKKSYVWSTKRAGRVWWKHHKSVIFPDFEVALLTEVRELGVAFKFDRAGHAQSRRNRFEAGLASIERLRQLPRPVKDKAALLQRSIWPACLFGSEGHVHTIADFQLLRGKASRAVFGNHPVMSPHLALAAVTANVQDPQCYCLLRQLGALQRAFRTDVETAVSVVELAVRQRPQRSSHGPATALRLSLDRLGLELTDAGLLKGPDNHWVDVTACRPSQLRDLVRTAWSYHVQSVTQQRNGLAQALPTYLPLTSSLFAKLTSSEQLVIGRHVTGAFSSAAAKCQWHQDVVEHCPLCGMKQTKEHKFLHCPKLAHVRADWSQTLAMVTAHWPHWIHGPFAVLPAGTEVLRLVFQTRTLPETAAMPAGCCLPGPRGRFRLFTDGSCLYPETAPVSRASFAVVLDTTEADRDTSAALYQWRLTGLLPQQFHVLSQGFVPGEQTINRAEICAILMAARSVHQQAIVQADIFTDSQVAMDAWDKAKSGLPGPWPDLDEQLQRVVCPGIELHKIASHQRLDELCGLPQWLAAGNTVADAAAKAALQKEMSFAKDLAEAGHESLHQQRDLLWCFWRYLLCLSHEENQLLKAQALLAVPPTAAPGPVPQQGLTAWRQLDSGPFRSFSLPPVRREWLLCSYWPPWFTVPLWNWLREQSWSQNQPTGRTPPGTAYLELLVGFVVGTGVCPPASLEAAGQTAQAPITFNSPLSLRHMIATLISAIKQLERCTKRTIVPPRRKKVFSLRSLGYREPRIGFSARLNVADSDIIGPLLFQVLIEDSFQPMIANIYASANDRCWLMLKSRIPGAGCPALNEPKWVVHSEGETTARGLSGCGVASAGPLPLLQPVKGLGFRV